MILTTLVAWTPAVVAAAFTAAVIAPVWRPTGRGAHARPAWRADAACRDEDTELWFPVGTRGPARDQAERAMQVCRACPAQAECLEWALATGQDHGIWGGHSTASRRRIRARRGNEAPAQ